MKGTTHLSDSEADEGFIADTIRIETEHSNHSQKPRVNRPVDMQPRFISRLGLALRKEPEEVMHTRFSKESNKHDPTARKDRRTRKTKQKPRPLGDSLNNPESFKLVYQRMHERAGQVALDLTSVIVSLEQLADYNEDDYSLVRPFKLGKTCQPLGKLSFDSRFESGNLMLAYESLQCPGEYRLLLQNDTNTRGYNQWFYFSVENMKAGQQYTLRLVNFKKKHSLFAEGMRPFVFSLKRHFETGEGYCQAALDNICYEQSPYCQNENSTDQLYQLSFDIKFEHSDDYVLISMGLPYSYSRLMTFLRKVKPPSSVHYQEEILTHSLSNNALPMLTITSPLPNLEKKVIGIIARQHPGETWSSHLMEQLINQLISNSPEATYLRDKFIFRIIPMVNVDGVIYGNFRCDISGFDLNRQWRLPNRILHPQIWALKNSIHNLSKQHPFQMFLDLHGHSKKYNTFCYSCKEDPYSCRVLPLILSKLTPLFHFPSCTFGIDRTKENTARAFVYQTIKKVNVLTIEISFFGSNREEEARNHHHASQHAKPFLPSKMQELAVATIAAIHSYESGAGQYSPRQIEQEVQNRFKEFLEYDRKNEGDSGSESDPYSDQLDEEDYRKIMNTDMLTALQSQRQFRQRKANKQNTELSNKSNTNLAGRSKNRQGDINKRKLSIVNDRKRADSQGIKKQVTANTVKLLKPNQLNRRPKEQARSTLENYSNAPVTMVNEVEPKIMFRTRNAIFSNKINVKSSFKEFNFAEGDEQYLNSNIPRHNRLQMGSRNEPRVESRQSDIQYKQKNFEYPAQRKQKGNDQALARKIEQTIYPLLHQRSLNHRDHLRDNQQHSEMLETNYPFYYLRPQERERSPTLAERSEPNRIFSVSRRLKNPSIINYERFHRRPQLERSRDEGLQRGWHSNMVRYSRNDLNGWTEH